MKIKKEKVYISLAVSILFSVTLIMLGPSFMYFYNVLEYPFTYMNILPAISLLTIFTLILLTFFLTFIKKGNIHKYIVAFVFSIGVLLWLQGHFLVWNYGVLDGSQIDWAKYRIKGIIDISIWISFISFCLLKKEWVYKYAKSVSYLIVSIQIIVLAFTIFTSPKEPDWKRFSLTNDELFSFSNKSNIIIFILDTFQSDILQEITIEEPNWKQIFDGFTYYRNSTGGFPTTYPSVPLILTGEKYKNGEPIQDFIDRKYSESSLPKILSENNYNVELYPINKKTILINDNYVSNSKRQNNFKIYNMKNIYKITLFRFSPHFLKKFFYNDTFELLKDDSIVKDKDFYRRLDEFHIDNNKESTFKFYHLQGAHRPFGRLTNLVGNSEMANNREGFKAQSRASLIVVKEFFEILKRNNIYDKTMVFIVGDHGANYGVNTKLISGNNEEGRYVDKSIISAGLPLVMFKDFDSRGKLETIDAPVDLGDIPKTIASKLGLQNDFPGEIMTNLNSDDIRIREFYYYQWDKEGWDKEYLPPMERYEINGFSWKGGSWNKSYKKYTNNGVKNYELDTINFGETMNFGKGYDGYKYLGAGWSLPQNGYHWSNGKSAYLNLPLPKSNKPIILNINFTPYLPFENYKQDVNIIINGKVINWHIERAGKQDRNILILNNNNTLDIKFEFPNAISPEELGISNDSRKLGIAIHSLKIAEDEYIPLSKKIYYKEENINKVIFVEGWSISKGKYIWTDNKDAILNVPLNNINSDLTFISEINPLIVPGKIDRQRIEVVVNGQSLGNWEFTTAGKQEWNFKIPKNVIGESSSLLNIEFKLPDAISPYELGINNDKRVLGLRFYSMKLEN